MTGIAYRRKRPSPFKLHLHKQMQHIPISYLGLMTVQEMAAFADPAFELMTLIRNKAFDEALPQLPAIQTWLSFYRDHRALTRGLGNQMPLFAELDGDESQDLLDGSRAISNYEQVRPGVTYRFIRRELGSYKLRQLIRIALKQQPRLYKAHLLDLRRNLDSNFGYAEPEEADFGEVLNREPAVYFYVRTVLPAVLLWQTTPQRLLRQVRSSRDEKKRSEAVERLLRLDPQAGQMPEVREWINVPDGAIRQVRRDQTLLWQQQGLDHDKFEPAAFKAMLGALIQSTVRRLGCYFDFMGRWHKADITAAQVRGLFHAAAKDRAGGNARAFDADVADMQLESWRRQLLRYRPAWDKIIPAHPGLKLTGSESGGD